MSEHTNPVERQSSLGHRNLQKTLLASAIASAFSMPVLAQSEKMLEEVVVTGTRATIQDSINLKRMSTEIVNGVNAKEIGEIPALSIGEALETITGAAAHRENGGATENSVRGLGPFLGTTVINGREATNGGGNRAVNYSIFPSEMFNVICIHKTQSAKYIEGAVSGQVHLDTRRPIDYGKQSIQLNHRSFTRRMNASTCSFAGRHAPSTSRPSVAIQPGVFAMWMTARASSCA